MEILENQLDDRALTQIAAQAIDLLCARRFELLAQQFPYALAHDREPASAVADDLATSVSESPTIEAALTPENATYRVKYFKPNDETLHALVECRFLSARGDTLLVEFVVIGKGRMFLALEGISVDLAGAAL